MSRRLAGQDVVAKVVDWILELDRAACLALWRETFGMEAPKRLSVEFMRRALAHETQAREFGPLSKRTRRVLRAAASDPSAAGHQTGQMNPGARLLREWNGRTHEVEVLPDGFLWKGRRFRSLSAVTREITGARWSGPRFFGSPGRR